MLLAALMAPISKSNIIDVGALLTWLESSLNSRRYVTPVFSAVISENTSNDSSNAQFMDTIQLEKDFRAYVKSTITKPMFRRIQTG